MKRLEAKKALDFIDRHKVVLTFPDNNRVDPPNLWKCFHPRKAMKWEWDSGADHLVSDLWIFREELSRSGKTVYAKWFQGKATFVDLDFLPVLLAALGVRQAVEVRPEKMGLSPLGRTLFEALVERSPLSTKELKKETGLRGRDLESEYSRGLKELWSRLWIVGWGEKDDGAFPSLQMAATKHLFEKQWRRALELDALDAASEICDRFANSPRMLNFFQRLRMKHRSTF